MFLLDKNYITLHFFKPIPLPNNLPISSKRAHPTPTNHHWHSYPHHSALAKHKPDTPPTLHTSHTAARTEIEIAPTLWYNARAPRLLEFTRPHIYTHTHACAHARWGKTAYRPRSFHCERVSLHERRFAIYSARQLPAWNFLAEQTCRLRARCCLWCGSGASMGLLRSSGSGVGVDWFAWAGWSCQLCRIVDVSFRYYWVVVVASY